MHIKRASSEIYAPAVRQLKTKENYLYRSENIFGVLSAEVLRAVFTWKSRSVPTVIYGKPSFCLVEFRFVHAAFVENEPN